MMFYVAFALLVLSFPVVVMGLLHITILQSGRLARRFRFIHFLRHVCCKWLPWHSGNFERTGFDGCSIHARCRWCGYEGMIDSQGNLF